MTHASFIDPQGDAPARSRDAWDLDIGTFFEVSLDLLVIRDLEGRVLKASRSWQTILGHDPEDMEGLPLLRLVHPEDLPGTQTSVTEVEQLSLIHISEPTRPY